MAVLLPLLRALVRALLVPHAGQFLLYFAAPLGVGFIFLEIGLVQRFVLLLGEATYALTVVLSSFLIGAGIGARLGERLPNRPAQVLPTLTAALTFGSLSVRGRLSERLRLGYFEMPFAVRGGSSALLLLPIGALLGTLLPYGIRLMADGAVRISFRGRGRRTRASLWSARWRASRSPGHDTGVRHGRVSGDGDLLARLRLLRTRMVALWPPQWKGLRHEQRALAVHAGPEDGLP